MDLDSPGADWRVRRIGNGKATKLTRQDLRGAFTMLHPIYTLNS